MNSKLIIFDMDGTLIDSGNVIANTINYVRDNLGLKAMEKNILLEAVNNPHINPAKFFYDCEKFIPNHRELFEEYYKKNCVCDIILYSGIIELLDKLSNDGYKLSIATNAYISSANEMINHLGISHYFQKVIGADMVKNPKPHPDMVYKILDELDICNTKSLLIGDSEKDMMAAKNANVKSIMVNWGFSDHSKKSSVSSIDELYENICNHSNI